MDKSRRVIPVSFKDDEAWMYDFFKRFSSPGSAIKDILKPMLLQNLNDDEKKE